MVETNNEYYSPNTKLKAEGQEIKFYKKGITFADLYEIANRTIQKGGVGEAILCRNKMDKKYYVLKTLQKKNENNKEKIKNLFRKEIEFALKLEKNPYIVYTQTALQEQDKVYMAMELIGKQPKTFEEDWESSTLRDIITKISKMDSYRYAIEFCKGMQYLNGIGMKAHRDIKPENIFITENNNIKIADFGLVGLKNGCGGTEGYQSPEQVKGEETNIQSDIYSFGVVLYEIFNGGMNPYNETKTNLKEEEFILKEYEKEHPSKSCRDILQKCGEKEQQNRYKDFKELEKDLLKEAKKEFGDDFKVEELPTKELTAADYFYKGYGYNSIEQYSQALLLYDKSIEINPNNSSVYLNRSVVNGMLGKYTDTIKDCILVLKLNPNYADAYNNIGLAKQYLGKNQEAIEAFNKAIKLNPKDHKAYFNKGIIELQLGKNQEAIEDFSEVIKLDSKNAQAYYNRGLIKAKIGNNQEAIEDFRIALNLNLNDAIVYFNKGCAELKEGKNQEAIEDFSKVISLNPNDAQAYFYRADAKLLIEEFQAAIEDYSKIISLNPNDAQAYYYRGIIKGKLGKNQEAIEDFSEAIKLDSKNTQAYFSRGIAEITIGKNQEAIADFSKVIKLDFKNSKAYFYRGIAERQEGKNQEAIEDFSEVIKLDSNNIFGYLDRALTEEIEGQYQKAIEDYNKAIELKPNFVKGYEILIEIYKKLGKDREVKEVENRMQEIIKKKQ